MCQIIDQNIFSSETNQIDNTAQQKNIQTLLFKSVFQDHFSNLKFLNNKTNNFSNFSALGVCNLFYSNLQLLIEIHFQNHAYHITGTIIQHGKGISIQQYQIRKSLSKQFSKKHFVALFQNYSILLSMDNGQWLIKSPIIYSDQGNIKQLKKSFHKAIMKLREISKNFFINISKLLNQNIQNIGQQKRIKLNRILRYYYRCTTQSSISIKSDCAEYQSAMARYSASRCGLQELLLQNRKANQFGKQVFYSLYIYGQKIIHHTKSKYLDQITLKQKQIIQQQIIIPSYSTGRHNKQNKFVYNNCYFLKPKYQQILINHGGNADIYVIKPQIYQYNSTNAIDQKNFTKNQILSKYITKHLVFKKYHNQTSFKIDKNDRNTPHQNQIVSYFRGGSCVFLPKYYFNIEKQSPYYNNLFMDYLPGDTLDDFVTYNSRTISALTKFIILLQILQTLRFLSSNGVVHLDIKQKNIIIMKNIVSKIFDFGESYQYKVCGENHKAKYTTIYGCPQVVTSFQGRIYTQKSDVFSFGIMAHKVLFQKYPYIFGDNSLFEKYNFQKKLRDKTFYCPQSIYQLGYLNIFEIINQLILKCIDMNEYRRPYLDWLTIILKSSLNYITNE